MPAGTAAANGTAAVLAARVIETPVGPLLLEASAIGLRRLHFDAPASPRAEGPDVGHDVIDRAEEQLGRYFAGERTAFDLPLDLIGTDFQQEVWAALRTIPYGATWSYGELARRVGRPGASRAVGMANNRNPVGIIVPCHRVVGADGSLTGYAGGLDRKRHLLDLESGTAGLPI